MLPRRSAFLMRALNLIGTPYVWGGKGHFGIDCSGVVTLALFECGGPDWRVVKNTDRLWMGLPTVLEPRSGDLAFYGGSGPDDVSHVMVCLELGLVVGACGGDQTTRTVELARRIGARVRVHEHIRYRSDIRGFRSLAPYFEEGGARA